MCLRLTGAQTLPPKVRYELTRGKEATTWPKTAKDN